MHLVTCTDYLEQQKMHKSPVDPFMRCWDWEKTPPLPQHRWLSSTHPLSQSHSRDLRRLNYNLCQMMATAMRHESLNGSEVLRRFVCPPPLRGSMTKVLSEKTWSSSIQPLKMNRNKQFLVCPNWQLVPMLLQWPHPWRTWTFFNMPQGVLEFILKLRKAQLLLLLKIGFGFFFFFF